MTEPVATTAVVFTPFEILTRGLQVVGFKEERIKSVGLKKNLSRFRSAFVGHPRVYADLFGRLQSTDIDTARIDCAKLGGVEKTLNYFFMAIYLLANYPTEEKAESIFSFGP